MPKWGVSIEDSAPLLTTEANSPNLASHARRFQCNSHRIACCGASLSSSNARIYPAAYVPDFGGITHSLGEVDELQIAFEGRRAARSVATWGQRQVWSVLRYFDDEASVLTLGGTVTIPPATKSDVVADVLQALFRNHESLRTTHWEDPAGKLWQGVRQAGIVVVKTVDLDRTDELEDEVKDLSAMLEEKPFRYSDEIPIRAGMISCRGEPCYLVFAVSHLVCDAEGLDILLREISRRLQESSAPSVKSNSIAPSQPIERAKWEQSDEGQRVQEKNLRFFRETLLEAPPSLFRPTPIAPQKPRYWQGKLESPAAQFLTQLLAARHRVSAAAVIIAATAVVLVRPTMQSRSVIQIAFNNRIRKSVSGLIAPITHHCPILVDISSGSFGEVARAVYWSMIRAHRHAEFDPMEFEKMRADVERSRGELIDISYFVNYRDLASSSQPLLDSAQEWKRAVELRRESRFSWRLKMEKNPVKYYVHAVNGADGMHLIANSDTCYLAPAEIEAYLWSTENVLVSAAADDRLDANRLT
jgi:hypothetical protein